MLSQAIRSNWGPCFLLDWSNLEQTKKILRKERSESGLKWKTLLQSSLILIQHSAGENLSPDSQDQTRWSLGWVFDSAYGVLPVEYGHSFEKSSLCLMCSWWLQTKAYLCHILELKKKNIVVYFHAFTFLATERLAKHNTSTVFVIL